mgnify:CR=1 FL=1
MDIESLDGELRGVGWIDGTKVWVPGCLPGDRVRVRVAHVSPHRNEAWAELVKGPSRQPDCAHAWPLAGRCGGCPGMHVPYEEQLAAKAVALSGTLSGARPDRVRPAPRATGWRNRANFEVARLSGRVVLGSRAPRSADVVGMRGCVVVRPPLAELASAIEDLGPDPDSVRYVSLRCNREGEALVELIVRDASATERLVEPLRGLPGVVGVAASVNRSRGNAIRVAPAETVAGATRIVERFGSTPAYVRADSFLQLNPEVADEMYAQAVAWSEGARRVVDLYCGVGPLGLSVAQAWGARLMGVEVHAAATGLAQRAADELGVDARFVAGDLTSGPPPEEALEDADVLLVNPPRRGLDAPVRAALAARARGSLVYMSCNPATFARDAAALTEGGWVADEVLAWDMLPNTSHVELLAHFRA